MRLLIVTQIVDTEDSYLGFFVRWIEEFAKHVESVEVICLKEGNHNLPKNVRVHSLGKEKGVSKLSYIFNFYTYIWHLRKNYDTVFVHMNPEYMALGGLFWCVWQKRIALWYTHKSVDTKLRIAAFFANIIFTASKESFRLATKKVRVVGHGIDTDFFSPDPGISRGTTLLSVGRLMPSKRHDLVIRAAAIAGRELRIAGEGPERKNLETLAHTLGAKVHFLGGLTQEQLRDEYRKAAFFLHASETGSLDKVVLEALACGLPVITTNIVLRDLPVIVTTPSPESIAKKITMTHYFDTQSYAVYVHDRHSLTTLIPRILKSINIHD